MLFERFHIIGRYSLFLLLVFSVIMLPAAGIIGKVLPAAGIIGKVLPVTGIIGPA